MVKQGIKKLKTAVTHSDLWMILTEKLTWIPALVACGVVAAWSLLAFANSLPNPYRALLLWSFIILLCCGADIVNPEGRAG